LSLWFAGVIGSGAANLEGAIFSRSALPLTQGRGRRWPRQENPWHMAKKFPIVPLHPERICWGCDIYCPADSLVCGNGTVRTPHPG
jgi:hypothetical protein